MNKTKILGKSFNFYGPIIQKGETLDFYFINSKDQKKNISNIKGIKLLSFFPDINTKICDKQTQWIMKNAPKSNIKFISISTDNIKKQAKWCVAHSFDNVSIVSDYEQDFGKKTGLLINKIKKLGRGFMVLDENNKIIDLTVNEKIDKNPDFSIPEKYL